MRYGFVYVTENLTNGRKYIGQHVRSQNPKDPDDSWYLGSSTNEEFWKDLKKCGKDNFVRTLLEDVDDQSHLNYAEISRLVAVDAKNNPLYYNKSNTCGGFIGPHSSPNKDKVAINNGEFYIFIYKEDLEVFLSNGWIKGAGKKFSDKMSMTVKGRAHTQETKNKIKEIMSGPNNPNLGTTWVNDGISNIKISKNSLVEFLSKGYSKGLLDVTKQRNSDSVKKVWENSDYRSLQSSLRKGRVAHNKGSKMSDDQKEAVSNSVKSLWEDPEYRKKISESRKGKIWITKGTYETNKYIKETDIDLYLSEGYTRGKIRK